MTRPEYRALLRVQGPIWAEYTFWNDWSRLDYWALNELYDYLTGKD